MYIYIFTIYITKVRFKLLFIIHEFSWIDSAAV